MDCGQWSYSRKWLQCSELTTPDLQKGIQLPRMMWGLSAFHLVCHTLEESRAQLCESSCGQDGLKDWKNRQIYLQPSRRRQKALRGMLQRSVPPMECRQRQQIALRGQRLSKMKMGWRFAFDCFTCHSVEYSTSLKHSQQKTAPLWGKNLHIEKHLSKGKRS